MMPVKAIAWEEKTDNRSSCNKYRVQVEDVAKRSLNKVRKNFIDWCEFGNGTNFKTNRHLLLFTRIFKSKKDWKEWAKGFPYVLFERTKGGKLRPMNESAKKETK